MESTHTHICLVNPEARPCDETTHPGPGKVGSRKSDESQGYLATPTVHPHQCLL